MPFKEGIVDMNVVVSDHQPRSSQIVKKMGHTIVTLTPDEMKLWYAAVKPIHEAWIEKMEAKGLPGKEVFEESQRLTKKYSND